MILPTKELDPFMDHIKFAGFVENEKCSLDVHFDPEYTKRLFAYSVKRHLPLMLAAKNYETK